MKLNEITKLVWNNSIEINFGNQKNWDQDIFLKRWIDDKYPGEWKNETGLYWIATDAGLNTFKNLSTPSDLPQNACDFAQTTQSSLALFKEDICHYKSHLPVIYNGHRNKVFSRLRAHFCLNNDKTGALGVNYYPFHNYHWKVYIFHKKLIERLPFLTEKNKEQLKLLIDNRKGRVAIESTWRAIYGWPILCKS